MDEAQGHQSPPPERQSGKQMHDTLGSSGQGLQEKIKNLDGKNKKVC